MGVTAARHAQWIVANTEKVLAIELLCAAQGLDCGERLAPGRGVQAAYAEIRARVAPLDRDRFLAPDLRSLETLIADGALVAAVEAAVGELAVEG